LKKILGTPHFLSLAHHVVVGNQVIVTGWDSRLVVSFLEALKSLLPKGCCRVTPYSHEYQESWKCNFLGLSPDVSLSDHVTSSEMFVLVDIVRVPAIPVVVTDNSLDQSGEGISAAPSSSSVPYSSSLSGPSSDVSESSMSGDAEDVLVRDYVFRMSSPTCLPDKVPTVLEKMMMALHNENLCVEVVDTALTCLKEEWMNKVKVLFKFTKAGGNRSEEDTRKLLQVVGAREEDKLLLKFWMTGLSVQYRTHILASSAHR